VRILYGVCGEGLGHAIRSAVVGAHLRGLGHDVSFLCSPGRAFDHLRRSGAGRVIPTLGTHMALTENKVDPVGTFLGNAFAQMAAGPTVHAVTGLMASAARPDVVITDFEPFAARFAGAAGLPLIAVDNVHFATRCAQPASVSAGGRFSGLGDALAERHMRPVVQHMVPGARRYLVTSFVPAGVAPAVGAGTTLHLPILRPETLCAARADGAHVVVYFNDKAARPLHALQGLGARFHVYGTGVTERRTLGDVELRPMSGEFLSDMATARAVIAGAGFTTMTEAIYLGKPLLAVPFEGQYEQILNANHLALAGYGERASSLDRETVSGFLGRADGYRRNLAGLVHDGNRELLSSVEAAIGGH